MSTKLDKNPPVRFYLLEVFSYLLFLLGEYAHQVNLIVHQGKTKLTGYFL